jgi:hypothetical protein
MDGCQLFGESWLGAHESLGDWSGNAPSAGLVVAALADILLFRFVIRVSLLETAGWVAFVFLQVACPPCCTPPSHEHPDVSLASGMSVSARARMVLLHPL